MAGLVLLVVDLVQAMFHCQVVNWGTLLVLVLIIVLIGNGMLARTLLLAGSSQSNVHAAALTTIQ